MLKIKTLEIKCWKLLILPVVMLLTVLCFDFNKLLTSGTKNKYKEEDEEQKPLRANILVVDILVLLGERDF